VNRCDWCQKEPPAGECFGELRLFRRRRPLTLCGACAEKLRADVRREEKRRAKVEKEGPTVPAWYDAKHRSIRAAIRMGNPNLAALCAWAWRS